MKDIVLKNSLQNFLTSCVHCQASRCRELTRMAPSNESVTLGRDGRSDIIDMLRLITLLSNICKRNFVGLSQPYSESTARNSVHIRWDLAYLSYICLDGYFFPQTQCSYNNFIQSYSHIKPNCALKISHNSRHDKWMTREQDRTYTVSTELSKWHFSSCRLEQFVLEQFTVKEHPWTEQVEWQRRPSNIIHKHCMLNTMHKQCC